MAERRPFIWLRWHWITRLTVVAAFATLFWVNLDYSRENYVEELANGYKGGVRFGFPLIWWDSGKYASAVVANDRHLLQTVQYGGINWPAAGVDLIALGATVLGLGVFAERLVRRVKPASGPAVSRPQVAFAATMAVGISLLLLLWLNLIVSTELDQTETGITMQYKSMGWPLASYTASEPMFLPSAKTSAAVDRVLLQTNPDLWRRRAHWEERNIVLNIFIAVALASAAGMLTQFVVKRPRPQPATTV